jgi:glucose-1-phosphatase
MKYSTIIFDLGKVIFDYSWDPAFDYFSKLSQLPASEVKKRLAVDEDPYFKDFERGIVSPQEYIDHASKLLKFPLTLPQFFDGWNSIYGEVYEGIDDILADLELKHLLVALTNTNPVHAEVWRERYANQLEFFSYIFCSNEMHSRKPEPAIYEQVLRSTGSKPNETVFFDDRKDNVEAARALGIEAWQVASPAEIRAAIKTLAL